MTVSRTILQRIEGSPDPNKDDTVRGSFITLRLLTVFVSLPACFHESPVHTLEATPRPGDSVVGQKGPKDTDFTRLIDFYLVWDDLIQTRRLQVIHSYILTSHVLLEYR